MNSIPSVLMCVGKQHYKLYRLISEAQNMGLSKRISKTSIPDGLVPFKSKIFVAHPDAILRVTKENHNLIDLALTLFEAEQLTYQQVLDMEEPDDNFWSGYNLEAGDTVPEYMLTLALALDRCDDKTRAGIIKEFGIEFCMGIVGFSYITNIIYVTRPGEEELPEELAPMEGYIQPVKVIQIHEEQDNE